MLMLLRFLWEQIEEQVVASLDLSLVAIGTARPAAVIPTNNKHPPVVEDVPQLEVFAFLCRASGAATDHPGLGTPEVHPYLVGFSEGAGLPPASMGSPHQGTVMNDSILVGT
jgi:hypothetical protein